MDGCWRRRLDRTGFFAGNERSLQGACRIALPSFVHTSIMIAFHLIDPFVFCTRVCMFHSLPSPSSIVSLLFFFLPHFFFFVDISRGSKNNNNNGRRLLLLSFLPSVSGENPRAEYPGRSFLARINRGHLLRLALEIHPVLAASCDALYGSTDQRKVHTHTHTS